MNFITVNGKKVPLTGPSAVPVVADSRRQSTVQLSGIRITGHKETALHQLGFMPGVARPTMESALRDGIRPSRSGLVWLRPAAAEAIFASLPEAEDMVRVAVPEGKRILQVADREELAVKLGWESAADMGSGDDPEVAAEMAEALRELNCDGFQRLDFPEMALLATAPLETLGRLKGGTTPKP